MSSLGLVYPSLLLIYLGQGAYLVDHPTTYSSLFYSALPTPVYWPMFVISILASIVASQSIVTGGFHLPHVAKRDTESVKASQAPMYMHDQASCL